MAKMQFPQKNGNCIFHDKLISQPVEYNKKRGISIHSIIKTLPPLERRPDGSLYRMTPAQRKQAASLIRRECCCCEDGNCMPLDDGGHLHLSADSFFLGLL